LGESDFQSIKTSARIGSRVNRTKIHLVTSAGLIFAKVVSVDAANDLALLKAGGRCWCWFIDVAADVSPLILIRRKLEPTHVGCYGKSLPICGGRAK
jgi:hypothetical protein